MDCFTVRSPTRDRYRVIPSYSKIVVRTKTFSPCANNLIRQALISPCASSACFYLDKVLVLFFVQCACDSRYGLTSLCWKPNPLSVDQEPNGVTPLTRGESPIVASFLIPFSCLFILLFCPSVSAVAENKLRGKHRTAQGRT